jgi:hypothetical protein
MTHRTRSHCFQRRYLGSPSIGRRIDGCHGKAKKIEKN